MLALLAEDVASIPPEFLEVAIDRHVVSSPYMPKAADLIRLAKEAATPRTASIQRRGGSYAEDLAAEYNSRLTRDDVEWIVGADGGMQLVDKPSASAARTKELEATTEAARRQFNHRQQYPVSEAAE